MFELVTCGCDVVVEDVMVENFMVELVAVLVELVGVLV